MEWDNSCFDRAFERIGVRQEIWLVRSGQPDFPFKARFDRPDQVVMDGEIHTTDYSIEYTTAEVQGIKRRSVIRIGDETYRVKEEPLVRGDGYWSIAQLEQVP